VEHPAVILPLPWDRDPSQGAVLPRGRQKLDERTEEEAVPNVGNVTHYVSDHVNVTGRVPNDGPGLTRLVERVRLIWRASGWSRVSTSLEIFCRDHTKRSHQDGTRIIFRFMLNARRYGGGCGDVMHYRLRGDYTCRFCYFFFLLLYSSSGKSNNREVSLL
jgi:hypothetical protein